MHLVCIHRQDVERRTLDNSTRMHEQRSTGVYDGCDVGHSDIVGMTHARIQKGCGEECVCHGVLRRYVVFLASIDQPLRFGIVGIADFRTRKAWVVPAAQIPLVESNFNAPSHARLIQQPDGMPKRSLGTLRFHNAVEIGGMAVGREQQKPVFVDGDEIELVARHFE